MSTLRISDAPLLPDVDGTEKIPTGGRGDYTISVDQIKGHIFQNIGKELVGLGNVDNTSDLDKPISTAQQAALNLKADKTYVDTNLELKADKTNVYTRTETSLALSQKADLVNGVVPENQIPSSFNDVLEFTTNTLPIVGESGKIYVTTDTNRIWRWGDNQYVEISNGGVSDSALKLQTARKIANVDFNGTQDINIPHNNLTNRNVANAHAAEAISTATGENQQDINDYTGAKWRNKAGGYEINARVMLESGDIVKSTVDGNTVDPNVDVTGWVKTNDASQIFYGNMAQSYINFDVYNTPEKYGADKDAADNTAALQAWLDSSETLHIRPFKSYKFSGTLNLNIANQSIIGLTHNTYGNSRLLYTGTGKAIKSTKNIGYLKLNDMQIVGAVTTENAVFETGTMGLDLTLGGTIEAYGLFLNGFETLILSAGTSFYNKFINCRLSEFKEGLKNFAAYNLNIHFCRFYRFTDALLTNGGAGPTNIKHNSFECFNGSIHRSNNDKCELSFHDNYVEIFDKIALPVNFTVAANQTKGNYFGGNMLFRGYYGRLSLRGNKLSIGGAFRLGAFSSCDHLESVGNGISLYASGNNLGLLFSSAGTYKSVNVNDFYNASLPGSGGYTQTYARSSFNNISDLRNPYTYYDCILDAMQPLVNRTVNFPSLLNGWVISTASGGTTVKAIANPDGSTTLVGSITGTAKTGNVILNIPTANRPTEVGSTQTYILLNTKSQNGTGGDVVLRYYYTTGDMEIFVEPTNLANILINLTIPQRI